MNSCGTLCALAALLALGACQKEESPATGTSAAAPELQAPKTETDKAGAPPSEPGSSDKAGADDKAVEGEKGTADKSGLSAGGAKVDKGGVSTGTTKVEPSGAKAGSGSVAVKKTASGNEAVVGGVKATKGADGQKKVNVGCLEIAK